MKRIIGTIGLLAVCCLATMAQAQISFDKKVHEFGVVLWKNPVTATFEVTNNGDKPLVISNVTTSCGCTVADWTKTPIAPGASGVVKSTFDAKALGRFQKSVGIYSNASERPIYLSIRGEVTADPKNYTMTHPFEIGPIRLDKENLEFDDAHKGDKLEMELLLANTSDKVLAQWFPTLTQIFFLFKYAATSCAKTSLTLNVIIPFSVFSPFIA